MTTKQHGFHLSINGGNNSTRIRLMGDLDLVSASRLTEVTSLDGGLSPDVRIDLSELVFIDAAGLRALLHAGLHLRTLGHRVQFDNPSPPVLRVAQILGIDL